jgi:hypothetical protein
MAHSGNMPTECFVSCVFVVLFSLSPIYELLGMGIAMATNTRGTTVNRKRFESEASVTQ